MRWFAALGLGLGILCSAALAFGQMTPTTDSRVNSSHVSYLGVTQSLEEHPSSPFAYFSSFLAPYVPNPNPNGGGSSEAAAFQVSEFFPAGINASGTTSGSWNTVPYGTYGGLSLARFGFHLDTCIEYQLHAWVEPGDFVGSGEFLLEAMPAGLNYHQLNAGEIHVTGRLAPGDYAIEGRSSFGTSVETFQGGTYSYIWTCAACANPIVVSQPVDRVVVCDSTVGFAVATSVPSGGLTFQWRRNGNPLVDSGHIGGATTSALTVFDACDPDTGYYDVLVSDGTILEPSRPARLSVVTSLGVDPGGPRSPRGVALELAGPNPFTRETAIRFATSEPRYATVAVYDVSGAKVRTLASRVLLGTGVFTWDGRASDGTRAPAGVYFVRVDAGALHESRRVVRLN